MFGYDWVGHQRHQALLRAVLNLTTRDRKAGQWQRPDRLPARGRPSGSLSDRFGRKRLLILARWSSWSRPRTALADTFTAFNLCGSPAAWPSGGLEPSPMYIAEVAPAGRSRRLVAMNQFTIVSGILTGPGGQLRHRLPQPAAPTGNALWPTAGVHAVRAAVSRRASPAARC